MIEVESQLRTADADDRTARIDRRPWLYRDAEDGRTRQTRPTLRQSCLARRDRLHLYRSPAANCAIPVAPHVPSPGGQSGNEKQGSLRTPHLRAAVQSVNLT